MLFPNFVFSFSLLSIVFAMPNKRTAIHFRSVLSKTSDYELLANECTLEQRSKFKREYLSVVLSYFINTYPEREALFVTYKEKLEAGYLQDNSIQDLFKKTYIFFKKNVNNEYLLTRNDENDKFLAPLVRHFEDQMVITAIDSVNATGDYTEPNGSSINTQSLQNIAEISASVADHLKISSQNIPTWFQIVLYAGSISGLIALSAIIGFSLTILRQKTYGSSTKKLAEHDQVNTNLLNVNSNEAFTICNESV